MKHYYALEWTEGNAFRYAYETIMEIGFTVAIVRMFDCKNDRDKFVRRLYRSEAISAKLAKKFVRAGVANDCEVY